MATSTNNLKVGFAKLQGENFVYYMQSYSFIIGHNTRNSIVDMDLGEGSPGRRISPQHARIYFDFNRMLFAMQVTGQGGCFINNVFHRRGCSPIQLKSQDLIQIGDKLFYFLLPLCSIWKTAEKLRREAGSSKQNNNESGDGANSFEINIIQLTA